MPTPPKDAASGAPDKPSTPGGEAPPLPDVAAKPPERPPFVVTNVKPRLIEIAGHRIPPLGTVTIDPKWEAGVRASSPFLAKWLVEGGPPALPASAPVNIGGLDEGRAIKLVGIETEIAALSVWADTEKRPAVLAAIQARVKEL